MAAIKARAIKDMASEQIIKIVMFKVFSLKKICNFAKDFKLD